MNISISDLLEKPDDITENVEWKALTSNSQFTLARILERSGQPQAVYEDGFTFDLLSKIPIENIRDTKNIGEKRASLLIQELVQIFKEMNHASKVEKKNYSPRLFPTKAELEAMKQVRDSQKVLPRGKLGIRRFPTKAELEALRAIKSQPVKRSEQEAYEMSNSKSKRRMEMILASILAKTNKGRKQSDDVALNEEVDVATRFLGIDNFEQLFAAINEILVNNFKFDKRSLAIITNRHGAFRSSGKTLEELGKELGITRERVRQIESSKRFKIELPYQLPLLSDALQVMRNCKDEDEFAEKLETNSISSGEVQSSTQLWNICRIFGQEAIASEILEVQRRWNQTKVDESRMLESVRSMRSTIGLLDISLIVKKFNISEEKAHHLILKCYPRSLKFNSLVLGRTASLDTMLENAISKQLQVKSPLNTEEIVEGIRRTARSRGSVIPGKVDDLKGLIEVLCGNPHRYEYIQDSLIKIVNLRDSEAWLQEVISRSELGILHLHEIASEAIREGFNLSSITVYLNTSPIIRGHGSSIYSLVGTKVDPVLLEKYSNLARSTIEQSKIDFEFGMDDTGILKIQPNLNVIISGIIFLPANLKPIFQNLEFETSCICEKLSSSQKVKFTRSGFWTGFTAMIRHGFSEHGLSKTSDLKLKFDFKNSKVVLVL